MAATNKAPKQNPALARKLSNLLDKEVKLYKRYQDVVTEEQKLVKKLSTAENAEKVRELTKLRQGMIAEMQGFHLERQNLLSVLQNTEGMRLSKIVELHFHPSEQRQLMPRIEALRSLMNSTRRQGREHNRLVGFSLKLVNGLVSLFLSATKNVVKSYTRSGKMKESEHPAQSRSQGVIKQA
jgi:hypothetical protein